MSQKTIMTGIDKAARAPAEQERAAEAGFPCLTWSTAAPPASKPLEPPLRPGELEREHSEPENDRGGFPGPA